MNRRNALHIIGATGLGAALPMQLSADTMLNEFNERWKVSRDYTITMMNAMPAENFDFKATPVQMTYGEQFTHTGSTNSYLLGVIKGKPRIPVPEVANKENTEKYLIETFDYCAGIISELTEEDLAIVDNKSKPRWLGKSSNRDILLRAYIHTAHHRGQAVVYLRLKGIKPPQFSV